VIVRFVDIGGINDHHYINFLSIRTAISQHISLNKSKMIMTYVDGNPEQKKNDYDICRWKSGYMARLNRLM